MRGVRDRELDTTTDQLTVTAEVECQHCEYQWKTESQMPRVACPSCQKETDRNVIRKTSTIPTRDLGGTKSIEVLAALFEERANIVRELNEQGWTTDSRIDSPNSICAVHRSQSDVAGEDGSATERPPITTEQWNAEIQSDDPTDGAVDYVCKCPLCEGNIVVQYEDWNSDREIVSEDEVFCYDCEKAVQKQLIAIQFMEYPKEQFRRTNTLRSAALKLKQMADWLHGLDQSGWHLHSVRDGYATFRYDVDDEEDVTRDAAGSLKGLIQNC